MNKQHGLGAIDIHPYPLLVYNLRQTAIILMHAYVSYYCSLSHSSKGAFPCLRGAFPLISPRTDQMACGVARSGGHCADREQHRQPGAPRQRDVHARVSPSPRAAVTAGARPRACAVGCGLAGPAGRETRGRAAGRGRGSGGGSRGRSAGGGGRAGAGRPSHNGPSPGAAARV